MHRPECADCRTPSPDLGTGFTTLASSSPATGWRLSREVLVDGSPTVVWRCPSCWKKERSARPGSGSRSGKKG